MKIASFIGGIILAAVAVFQQMALKPSAQAMAVQWLFLAILLVAVASLLQGGFQAPVSLILTTLAVYDITLLIRPSLPGVLVWIYTGLGFLGALLYLTISEKQLQDLIKGFSSLWEDKPALRVHRTLLTLFIPFWASAWVMAKTVSELAPPIHPRAVHPVPPEQMDVYGKSYSLAGLENPYRKYEKEDPEKFKDLVADGKKVYYQNCFYCHGDNLDGRGHYASALNPIPANFQDPGTIAMLQESFVFWRVTKGGPGLPSSGHPWNSAMPVWEKILSEDDVWKSILWIYSGTGHAPRTWEKVEH